MGLFDRLFGRKPKDDGADLEAAPAPAQPPTPASPKQALAAATELLGASKVHSDPDGFDEFEIRGKVGDRPARAILDDRPWLELELKGEFGARLILLHYNPDMIPKQADADDPWDEGEVRTFVSKGIYVEGDAEAADGYLERLTALPDDLRKDLFHFMRERLSGGVLSTFVVGGEELSLSGMTEYGEVSRLIEDGMPMLARVAEQVEQLPDPVAEMIAQAQAGAAPGAAPAPKQLKCGYCSSQYVASWDLNCPNCGAPPS